MLTSLLSIIRNGFVVAILIALFSSVALGDDHDDEEGQDKDKSKEHDDHHDHGEKDKDKKSDKSNKDDDETDDDEGEDDGDDKGDDDKDDDKKAKSDAKDVKKSDKAAKDDKKAEDAKKDATKDATKESDEDKAKKGDAKESDKSATQKNNEQGQLRTKTCEYTITANDSMQFNMSHLKVAADCAKLSVNFKHVGRLPKVAMGHNIVFAETSKVDGLIKAGLQAGPSKNYIPESADVLAASKLLSGGESDTVTLDVTDLANKDLMFFCLFPGHTAAMRVPVTFEKSKTTTNS